MKKKIAFVGGFWSTNIGNAFYNIGTKYLLKNCFPNDDLYFISDQQNYFGHNIYFKKKYFDINSYWDVDYIVLNGPMLNEPSIRYWKSTLKNIKKETKVILLSCGSMRYNEKEYEVVRRFLKKINLFILSTRDTYTYEKYHDLAEYSYDGICSAFFLPEAQKTLDLGRYGKFVVLNFDKKNEPKINYYEDKKDLKIKRGTKIFELLGKKWVITKNYMPIHRTLNIGEYKIIRTCHKCNPFPKKSLYTKKGIFISDIPYSYLNIYANADVVFSDRVHACVVSLAYGKHAMLFSNSPRACLFDKFNINDLKKKPVKIDLNKLEIEKTKLKKFLCSIKL